MRTNREPELDRDEPAALHTVTVPRLKALRRLWRAQTIYAVTLAGFAVLAVIAYLDPYFGWDLKVSRSLQAFTPPGLFSLMRFMSIFGNSWTPYALTTLTVILFLLFRRGSEAWGLTLSAGGSGLINTIFKTLIARPRPAPDLIQSYTDPMTNSFPSGHVTFYVTYFGFLFFTAYALLPRGSLLRRLALTLTALPVLLIGLSRIYLGAHWPSDTLGAYLWSGVWLAISPSIYRRWKERRMFHGSEKAEGSRQPIKG